MDNLRHADHEGRHKSDRHTFATNCRLTDEHKHLTDEDQQCQSHRSQEPAKRGGKGREGEGRGGGHGVTHANFSSSIIATSLTLLPHPSLSSYHLPLPPVISQPSAVSRAATSHDIVPCVSRTMGRRSVFFSDPIHDVQEHNTNITWILYSLWGVVSIVSRVRL